MSEIFSYGVAYAFDGKIFEKKGIELLDFTPEQIKDFVLEMVENLESKKEFTQEEKYLQETFKTLFADNIQRSNYPKEIKDKYNKFHGQIRSNFCLDYLKKNKSWLR